MPKFRETSCCWQMLFKIGALKEFANHRATTPGNPKPSIPQLY